jgi:epsilon-lactone hydrolase
MKKIKNNELPSYLSYEAVAFYRAAVPITHTVNFDDGEAVRVFRKEVHADWAKVTEDIDFSFELHEEYLGEIRALRITTDTTRQTDKTIFLLHGGAYVLGAPEVNASSAILLAQATGIPVLSIDYRLAPEHPFPAALNDARDAYLSLVASGCKADDIFVVGESAGAGLGVSLCLTLRDMDKALPGALVVLSIWADLETSGDSLTTLIDSDLDFGNLAVLYDCGHAYAGDNDLSLPLISPVNAALHDLPPMLIQVGAREMLLSDSLRLASNARDAGVPVDLDVWDGMGHMFQAIPSLPEAIRAHFRIGAFLENLG